jgi:hypothetical protein
MTDRFLGIDPGRSKAGWALTDGTGRLLASGIVAADDVALLLDALCSAEARAQLVPREGRWPSSPDEQGPEIIVGDGTGKAAVVDRLQARSLPFIVVDESFTTLRGRDLYWRLHRPRGLLRWLPRGLCLPPRDIDDLAAWALVLHHLGET